MIINKNLDKLLQWRSDICHLYPKSNIEVHLQLWWIRWGTLMFKNIPFWSNVSGLFMYKYIYEIDKKIFQKKYIPLKELMLIIADNEDIEFIVSSYYEFMFSVGVNKYFGQNDILAVIVRTALIQSVGGFDECYARFINDLERSCNVNIINDQKLIDVVLIGNPRNDTGLGIDKLTVHQILINAGLNVIVLSSDIPLNARSGFIFLALPLPSIYIHYLNDISKLSLNTLNVAYSPWELPDVPPCFVEEIENIDLIFYQSNFVKNGYKKLPMNHKKLKYLPPIIDVLGYKKISKLSSDSTIFKIITPFDLSSYQSRKNPFAAIDAFTMAFSEIDRAELCIKINSEEFEQDQLSILTEYLKKIGRADVYITSSFTDRNSLLQFYTAFDCCLHLHRSEGFGRNIAEFMSLGIPVITTNFSGNVDYCNSENSLLVNYRLVPIKEEDYLFTKDQFWAEPDVSEASSLLRKLYSDSSLYSNLSNNASKIKELFSYATASKYFKIGMESI